MSRDVPDEYKNSLVLKQNHFKCLTKSEGLNKWAKLHIISLAHVSVVLEQLSFISKYWHFQAILNVLNF